MHVIDGRALAETICHTIQQRVAAMFVQPCLAVLLVGDDPASSLYVSLKQKTGEKMGIRVIVKKISASSSDDELIAVLHAWNDDPVIHAILVQLPLPIGHDETHVLAAMDPAKDVDGFSPESRCVPPVHEGILRLVNETPLRINGSRATLIVNSSVFAAPLERLLRRAGSTVTMFSPDAIESTTLKQSDLIVIAIGRIGFLTADQVKNDAVIIDVGTNTSDDGRVHGDVNRASFEHTDAWITPVPGGVGPMTVAQLLKNVVELAA